MKSKSFTGKHEWYRKREGEQLSESASDGVFGGTTDEDDQRNTERTY